MGVLGFWFLVFSCRFAVVGAGIWWEGRGLVWIRARAWARARPRSSLSFLESPSWTGGGTHSGSGWGSGSWLWGCGEGVTFGLLRAKHMIKNDTENLGIPD